MTDVHASDEAVWLAKSTTHARLQSIGTSARQHLVDADDMVWMSADSEMETFFSGDFDEIPVVIHVRCFPLCFHTV